MNKVRVIICLILWFILLPLLIYIPPLLKDTELSILLLIFVIIITYNLIVGINNYLVNSNKLKKIIIDGINCVAIDDLFK